LLVDVSVGEAAEHKVIGKEGGRVASLFGGQLEQNCRCWLMRCATMQIGTVSCGNAANSGTSAGFGKYVMTRENGEVTEFPEAWWCGEDGGEAVALDRFTKLKFM